MDFIIEPMTRQSYAWIPAASAGMTEKVKSGNDRFIKCRMIKKNPPHAFRHLLIVLRETPTKCAIRFMLMPQQCIVFI